MSWEMKYMHFTALLMPITYLIIFCHWMIAEPDVVPPSGNSYRQGVIKCENHLPGLLNIARTKALSSPSQSWPGTKTPLYYLISPSMLFTSINDLYLKYLRIRFSSYLNTWLCNCWPCRMFNVYFYLYISLQSSTILLRRFRRQRKVTWLSR